MSLRKRDGSTLTYQYDALNRMIVKVVPERAGLAATHTRDVHYGYDISGLQLFARFDSVSGEGLTFTYDGFGRRLTEIGPLGTMTSTWDTGGRRTRLTGPAGYWVGFGRHATGEMTALLMADNNPLASFYYDGLGRRDYQTLLNGASATFARDPLDR